MADGITFQTPPTGAEAPPAPAPTDTPPAPTPTDTPPPHQERPEWIPEKFWKGSVEESAKAMSTGYSELEKKLGQPKHEDTPPPVEEPQPTDEQQAAEDKARDELQSKGLNFDKYAEAYANDGKLTDEHYAELEKAGVSKQIVDAYIAGQEALATNTRNALLSVAGGEESYGEMLQWASQNLTPEQIKAYNDTMDAGDFNAAALAIRGLKANFEEANGAPPTRVANGNGQAPTGDVYRSWQELTRDQGDQRYAKDPAFRKQVEDKLKRSPL